MLTEVFGWMALQQAVQRWWSLPCSFLLVGLRLLLSSAPCSLLPSRRVFIAHSLLASGNMLQALLSLLQAVNCTWQIRAVTKNSVDNETTLVHITIYSFCLRRS